MSMSNVAELPTWKNKLLRNKAGIPYSHERNVFCALQNAPELTGLFLYNEFSDSILMRRSLPNMPADADDALFQDNLTRWGDEHATWLTSWLTDNAGFAFLRRNIVQDVVVALSKASAAFHPVREYLDRCRGAWDGERRIDGWIAKYLGSKAPQAYLEAVGAKFLIGSVARIMRPGCQMDSMLVLEGGQGTGKSTAVRVLGREWSRDVTGDLGTTDAAIHIQGVWIGEMSELSSIRRSDQEAIKGFVSRRIDHYRPPYGRNAVDRPRHSVFIATTNESDYLQDPTGGRRFWPVECQQIDLPGLERDMDQLWGEAAQRFMDKEPWHLENDQQIRDAAVEQTQRQKLTVHDEDVLAYADEERKAGRCEIHMKTLLNFVFRIEEKKISPNAAGYLAAQASRTLMAHGWVKLKAVGRGEKRRQPYRYVGAPGDDETPISGSAAVEAHKPSQARIDDYEDDIPF